MSDYNHCLRAESQNEKLPDKTLQSLDNKRSHQLPSAASPKMHSFRNTFILKAWPHSRQHISAAGE